MKAHEDNEEEPNRAQRRGRFSEWASQKTEALVLHYMLGDGLLSELHRRRMC